MKDFEKKVALVTGGSRGIGREVCRELARRGATVVVAFGGNEAAANETLAIVQKESGGQGAIKRFDVADPKSCAEAVDGVVTAHGRLDVLVNNAGITSDALLLRAKDEDWERTLATNLQGPFSLMRSACRVMMKQRAGAIVNVSSVVGEMGNPGQAAYSASKAGLIGLTKAIARELGSRNVRVNAVTPGYIATDMTATLAEASKQALVENIALGRIGDPKEVAAAVVFLASDAAAYITGAVLRVNGGLYM